MIILFLIIASVFTYLVVDYYMVKGVVEGSHRRILDKINSVIDGVKTFFTVTLVDKISSAFESDKSDEIDEFDV